MRNTSKTINKITKNGKINEINQFNPNGSCTNSSVNDLIVEPQLPAMKLTEFLNAFNIDFKN